MRRVAVCVCTLGRPVGLRRLLDGLLAQEDPGVEWSVAVADNDAAGSARALVEEAAAVSPVPIRYVVQPERGIPFARNAAVALAPDVDAYCFVDDDEVPAPDWLAALVAARARYDADVVHGPVDPAFDEEPPAWIAAGGWFRARRLPTGTRRTFAATHNALVHRRALPGEGMVFNERLGLNGGDDTELFMRLRDEGRLMVWCEEARVTEHVPATRTGWRWLLRREFRRGNTLSLCLRELHDGPWRRFRRVVKAGLHVVRGLLRTVVGVRRGRAGVVLGLQEVALGAGLLSGLFLNYGEYATVHGR